MRKKSSSCPIPRFRQETPITEQLEALLRAFLTPNRRSEKTHQFERAFAKAVDSQDAIAVSSVRFGLCHTLEYLSVPAGSEILCTPLTVYPIIASLLRAGVRPLFADMHPTTVSMDLGHAEKLASERTRAILVTHLWGIPTDMDAVLVFAQRHNLVVLEDASQCLEGFVRGRRVGTFGRAGLFSLQVTKPVCAYGGAVMVTDDPGLAAYIRQRIANLPPFRRRDTIRSIGVAMASNLLTDPRWFPRVGVTLQTALLNSSLKRRLDPGHAKPFGSPPCLEAAFTDIQAFSAQRSLARLEDGARRRKALADRYKTRLHASTLVALPALDESLRPTQDVFVVFNANPSVVRKLLWHKERIDCAPVTVDACHELGTLSALQAPLPGASTLYHQTFFLPLYPSLKEAEIDRIAQAINQCCASLEPPREPVSQRGKSRA